MAHSAGGLSPLASAAQCAAAVVMSVVIRPVGDAVAVEVEHMVACDLDGVIPRRVASLVEIAGQRDILIL